MVQPDTFEAVRINLFNMLAELAQAFNEEQLDFLFKKFESSAVRCDADNKQGMLLLFRLAKVDVQVGTCQPQKPFGGHDRPCASEAPKCNHVQAALVAVSSNQLLIPCREGWLRACCAPLD